MFVHTRREFQPLIVFNIWIYECYSISIGQVFCVKTSRVQIETNSTKIPIYLNLLIQIPLWSDDQLIDGNP